MIEPDTSRAIPAPCPLCHQPAHFETVGGWRFRHYLCDRCGEFLINTDGVDHVHQMAQQIRDILAAGAKAVTDEDQLFTITVTRTPEGFATHPEVRPRRDALSQR